MPKADLKGGRRRPQAAAGRRLARDIVAEVDASEDGRILANVLFDACRRLARDIVVEVDASEDGRILANVLFDASSMVR